MKVYRSSKDFPKSIKKSVVALGNFDGVHRAHQKMFGLTKTTAKKVGGTTVIYTFHPHPVKVLSKASAPLMINTLEQKLELIATQGIDAVVVEPFELKFASLPAEDWFQKILVKRLHATAVVAGYDFTFGSKRSGTIHTMKALCDANDLICKILKAQHLGDTLISSTQIRSLVGLGEVQLATKLLGRPFFLEGEIIRGLGRGASIGIPTANLKADNELIPGRGVYACLAQIGNKQYPAGTNIGINPTFGGHSLSIETHILNFNRKIYGKKIRLHFIQKIRDEQTFASPADLVKQIHKDIQRAKKILKV